MAVIYIEKAGIKFSLVNGRRVIGLSDKSELSGTAFIESSGSKKYAKNTEKIATKIYKDKSYIIYGNTVYFYKAADLENINANLSPYQILINDFLKKKNICGNILLVDGNKDAVIVSLIINEEFKIILVSNSQVINETAAEIKKYISKEKIKLDEIIINDEFYKPVFKTSATHLNETEILEYSQTFNAPLFNKIEDIRKKIKTAQNKKLNFILIVATFIFVISASYYLYASNINNKYKILNNNLRIRLSVLRQKNNAGIEKELLEKVRADIGKKIGATLSKISAVPYIKIKTVAVISGRLIIKGTIIGGYRNFTRYYNMLKNITGEIGDKVNYGISSGGKTSFTVKGTI